MSQKIQKLADESGKEITSTEIWGIFQSHFLIAKKDFLYVSHLSSTQNDVNQLELKMMMNMKEYVISGLGNGPIDAFINGLSKELDIDIKVSDYHQSAISSGSDARAAAYIELEKDGETSWGVGINPNTTRASFEAIIVGLSKLI
jgi:2-isopropylmalate synthase